MGRFRWATSRLPASDQGLCADWRLMAKRFTTITQAEASVGERDSLDRHILLGESRLSRYLVQSITALETRMSELTDKIDAALTALQAQETASADTIAQQKAQIEAAAAAAAALQSQLDKVTAGEQADEAELQKVLDVLNALQNPPAPAPVPDPVPAPAPDPVPAPVDPTPPPVV